MKECPWLWMWIILPSCIGIVINQCKDPYETTSIIFFFVAQMTNSIDQKPLLFPGTDFLSVLIAPHGRSYECCEDCEGNMAVELPTKSSRLELINDTHEDPKGRGSPKSIKSKKIYSNESFEIFES